MQTIRTFTALGFVVVAMACSSNNNVDGEGANSGTVGGNGSGANNSNVGGANGSGTNPASTGGVTAGGVANTVGGTVSSSGAGTGGSTVCGAGACAANSCGTVVDACGTAIDCGFANCSQVICGALVPNECPACTPLDCAGQGKNCGTMPDGCGNILDCGTCTDPECCGCGNPSQANVCGSGGTQGSGLPSTCIVGSIGCLCDSVGGCAPGLTCNTTVSPTVCCSGTDCTLPGNTTIGSTCASTSGTATCNPGVTIPAITGTLDNCGYPAASFNESVIICGFNASGGGRDPAQIQVFYNDEHALTLGSATATYPVSALPTNPGFVFYPKTGDPSAMDTSGRPLRPVLYITDITADANCRAGDQQQGGKAYDPVAIFGTWKSATGSVPGANPAGGYNYWTLGANADPVPPEATAACPCTQGNCITTGHTGRGYATEVRYEAALISGHSYRLQVILHDGDQTQGGDSGEACVQFCAGTGTCVPRTCTADQCGPVSDGCGGTMNCRPCCEPKTCEQVCSILNECSTTYDSTVYALSCPKSDGCNSTIPCFCKIG